MENDDFERVKRVAEVKKIPSFAEFSRLIGAKNQQIFTDLKRGKYKITRNLAVKIHDAFPDISTLWLLTGEGGMYVGNIEQNNGVVANHMGDIGTFNATNERLTALLESQQATIKEQAETINKLTSLLTK